MDQSHFMAGWSESNNSCLIELYPSTIKVKAYAESLDKIGFRNFPKTMDFISEPAKNYGHITNPTASQNPLLIKKNEHLTISGWAILPDSIEMPKIVLLSHGSKKSFFTSAYVNLASPDIVKKLNSQRYTTARWLVDFSPKFMPLGKTVLKAWVYDSSRKQFVKLNGELEVKVES